MKNRDNYDCWTKLNDKSVKKWFSAINDNNLGRDIAIELVKQLGPSSLLEIGTGGGKDYSAFADSMPGCKYSGVDVSDVIVGELRLRYPDIDMTAASVYDGLPFEDNSFDITYARHVLVHCPYYQKPLEEMMRVSKWALVTVLFKPLRDGPDVRAYYDKKNDNRYNRKKFIEFASSLGDLELIPQGLKNKEIVVIRKRG